MNAAQHRHLYDPDQTVARLAKEPARAICGYEATAGEPFLPTEAATCPDCDRIDTEARALLEHGKAPTFACGRPSS